MRPLFVDSHCVVLDLDLPHSGLRRLSRIIPDRRYAPLAVVALTGARSL